jgi:hypothetical protein
MHCSTGKNLAVLKYLGRTWRSGNVPNFFAGVFPYRFPISFIGHNDCSMNSLPKLIASIAALIASLALLWFSFSANKFVNNITGSDGLYVKHGGDVTLSEWHF